MKNVFGVIFLAVFCFGNAQANQSAKLIYELPSKPSSCQADKCVADVAEVISEFGFNFIVKSNHQETTQSVPCNSTGFCAKKLKVETIYNIDVINRNGTVLKTFSLGSDKDIGRFVGIQSLPGTNLILTLFYGAKGSQFAYYEIDATNLEITSPKVFPAQSKYFGFEGNIAVSRNHKIHLPITRKGNFPSHTYVNVTLHRNDDGSMEQIAETPSSKKMVNSIIDVSELAGVVRMSLKNQDDKNKSSLNVEDDEGEVLFSQELFNPSATDQRFTSNGIADGLITYSRYKYYNSSTDFRREICFRRILNFYSSASGIYMQDWHICHDSIPNGNALELLDYETQTVSAEFVESFNLFAATYNGKNGLIVRYYFSYSNFGTEVVSGLTEVKKAMLSGDDMIALKKLPDGTNQIYWIDLNLY